MTFAEFIADFAGPAGKPFPEILNAAAASGHVHGIHKLSHVKELLQGAFANGVLVHVGNTPYGDSIFAGGKE